MLHALIEKVAKLVNRKNLGLASPIARAEEGSILDTDEAINNVKLPSNYQLR